ncbi:MAG: hypothetical protein KC549_06460 [Myxococcales bacterium]|nr:hypothetical protein [Myxococcales bacterium]
MDAPASDVRALAASGRLDEAEALLADHLSTQLRHGEARLGWAALAAEIGSVSLALDELRAAAHEAPDSASVATALADLAGELADLGVEHPCATPTVFAPPAPPPTEPDAATLARYLHAFGGREGVHARQWVSPQADGTLRQGYAPQQIPLTPRLAAAHLAGDCSLGTYLIRLDDTVTFFVIDLDIRRKALAAAAQDHQENRRVRQVLAASTAAIEARLGAHGLACIVEDSGHKGRHFWCLLQAPMAADLVHRFGRALLAALSADLPPELSLEFFPKQGRVDADGLGNLIKLPLGVHPVSGRRSTFLDRAGRPVETPWATLASTRRVAPVEVMAAFEALRADAAPPPPSPAEAPTPQAEAALRKVIAGCPVVATILTRAAETRRIGHDERIVLLHSLGHLAAGLGPIEALFRACPEVPLRDVPAKVRRGHPISCARIRARVPHITATVACHCEFPCLGEYPSPLLHAAGAT